MRSANFRFLFLLALLFSITFAGTVFSQSKPQKPEPSKGNKKKNTRPDQQTEEERKRAEEEKKAVFEPDIVKIETDIVNVDAVVYHKKSGQIITGLKKENFTIFEDGIKKDISSFTTPESPITVTLVVEYSRWTELFGSAAGGRFEPGIYEAVRPVAAFISRFIKPPDDYASVIAFDLRPTPITDFTNDPQRIRQTIELLLRNNPAFRENNLFDAIKFALIGGRGDSVVLDGSKDYDKGKQTEYTGMVGVKSKRRAIILVASGIDTFSKISYADARKIVQQAGIPLYIISTGNLFYKKYEHLLPAEDNIISGVPGRLSFLQARNAMDTFAKESGGMHFEMTFAGEIPGYLESINGLLRNQYSLAYDLEQKHEPGKKYKLEVKVDVDGDGQTDDKTYVVRHRPFVTTPKPKEEKKKS